MCILIVTNRRIFVNDTPPNFNGVTTWFSDLSLECFYVMSIFSWTFIFCRSWLPSVCSRWMATLHPAIAKRNGRGGGRELILSCSLLGKESILNNIFQISWNHQLVLDDSWWRNFCRWGCLLINSTTVRQEHLKFRVAADPSCIWIGDLQKSRCRWMPRDLTSFGLIYSNPKF